MASETLIETHAVVIGSGPGGYVCAIRLGQLGVPTVLVEKGALGGTCLNVGCIPSKALISASKLVEQARHAASMGLHFDGLRVDLRAMMAWKDGVVAKLTGGVGQLVRGNSANSASGRSSGAAPGSSGTANLPPILHGAATFAGPHELVVAGPEGQTRVRFRYAVIATGSVPSEIPGFSFDGRHVLSSTEALAFDRLPDRLVVIGGGYIGLELGGVWQRLGTKVTVVEYGDRLLPGFEPDLVKPVEKRFKGAGGVIRVATRAVGWQPGPDGVGVLVEVEDRATGQRETLSADAVVVTAGRRATTDGLGLAAAGLVAEKDGTLRVDGEQRTAVPHIFAIGDVAGQPMLAHKASKEGEVAAEVIAGHPAAFDVRAIPAVVFTDPEVATVGLSAREAAEAGHTVKVGKFPFAANGRALSLNDTEGFVRVIVDADSELLLGVEAVGPEVSNLIAEVGLALELGARASDLGLTIHAHPTLAEAVMEATNAALGQAIHALNR
jgi:dihydrolipoamide dehydrogenase